MAAPTGTDESTARTITIQADVNYGGKTRTYEYDALVLCEDGKWAVDPDSLSTGVLVEAGHADPRPTTLRRRPTPEPTPTPDARPEDQALLQQERRQVLSRGSGLLEGREASICR